MHVGLASLRFFIEFCEEAKVAQVHLPKLLSHPPNRPGSVSGSRPQPAVAATPANPARNFSRNATRSRVWDEVSVPTVAQEMHSYQLTLLFSRVAH